MTNKIKAEKIIYELIKDIVENILTQMGISQRFFPVIRIDKIVVKDGIASYDYEKHRIRIDILKIKNFHQLVRVLIHECEHLWQFIHYPEIMMFFVSKYDLYKNSYKTAFNLPEADAKTIELSNGQYSLMDMFEKYDVVFFEKHINDWMTQVSSMQEYYCHSCHLQCKQKYLVQIQDRDMISYNSRFLEFQHLIK